MKITIDIDPMALVHVAALSQTGLYGADVEETIQALAMEGLRAAWRDGFVPVAPEISGELAEEDLDEPAEVHPLRAAAAESLAVFESADLAALHVADPYRHAITRHAIDSLKHALGDTQAIERAAGTSA